jgi:regulator of protease activity HflC (stomatin/prohibitin superfamily)
MRSEIGKLTLDKTFEERDTINALILQGLKSATEPWGITCSRYEIKDIKVKYFIFK